MNWEAIGAISDAGAAIMVIVTLIYLSQQIRHATAESHLAAVHDISALYTNWLQSIAASQELSKIWDKGHTEYEALSKDERVRFLLTASSGMRIIDDAHRQYVSGRMKQTDWDVYERALDLAAGSSGLAAYFLQRKGLHTTKFMSLVDHKVSVSEKKAESLYN